MINENSIKWFTRRYKELITKKQIFAGACGSLNEKEIKQIASKGIIPISYLKEMKSYFKKLKGGIK